MAIAASSMRLSKDDAACIAGLIYGEGTITLSRLHAREQRRLVVSIASTELVLEQYLALTPRNGRYSPELLARRSQFESRLLSMRARRDISTP